MNKFEAINIIDRAQASMRDYLEGKINYREHERIRNMLRDLIAADKPLQGQQHVFRIDKRIRQYENKRFNKRKN